MHKNLAPSAGQSGSNSMVQLLYTNRDSAVWNVSEPISGKGGPRVLPDFGTGLDCGLWKTTLSGSFANYPGIAHSNLMASRITGWKRFRRRSLNTPRLGIWSTMRPIFTRKVVC